MHYLPGEAFGGEIHLLVLAVQGGGAVFFKGEGVGAALGVSEGRVGEVEGAVVHAEGNGVGADLGDGVVGGVEAVGAGVGAEQGGPGGPELNVELWGHLLRDKFRSERLC